MHSRKVLATAVAACAFVVAAPSGALAAKKPAKKVTPSTKAVPAANTAATDEAIKQLQAQVKALQDMVAKLDGQSGGVALLLSAAPQLVDGLTQLKNGLETLASAYTSVEYGVAMVNVGGGGTLINPPAWSADIPDDSNGTSISGMALYPNTNTGGVTRKTFTLNAYVRSNEANLGDNGPVAQAGGMMFVTAYNLADNTTRMLPCIGEPTTSGVGAITPVGEPINTPAGPIKTLPFTNITSAKSRTDQTLPGGDAPRLASCTVDIPAALAPVAPIVVKVDWSATFLDIPTTTSPGPRD
jgi:X-X-X-Leu-X-X-Gly heptad repeat protein